MAIAAELLNAERQLGRLVQQLADAGDLSDALTREARRREAWSSLQLEGCLVHLEDVATAQIDLALLPGAKHEGAGDAVRLLRAMERMSSGLTDIDDAPPPPEAEDDIEDLRDLVDEDEGDLDDDDQPLARSRPVSAEDAIAAARAAAADLEAFLQGGMTERRDRPTQGPRPLAPLSTEWMVKAWTLACGAPGDQETEVLERAVGDIDSALSIRPGLSGAALALHRLHAEGYWVEGELRRAPEQLRDWAPAAAAKLDLMLAERTKAGPGWMFARLIAPWIVGRACGLDGPAPWASECLLLGRMGYARAAEMTGGEWERWLCGILADGWTQRRRRLPEMRARLEKWQRTVTGDARPGRGGGRRPSRGGPLAILPILAAQPVVTADWLARRVGVSERAAQMTLGEMAKLGIVREMTGGYTHRVYEAVG